MSSDTNNIIRGRKSVEDDLANDTSKDNYICISKYEEDRKKAKQKRKDRASKTDNGNNDISQTHVLAEGESEVDDDLHMASLNHKFAV